MKIGLVTFANSLDNYGELIQCYATQRFLMDQGHDVWLLRKKNQSNMFSVIYSKSRAILKRLLNSLSDKELLFLKWTKQVRQNEKKHPRYFERFRQDNYQIQYGDISDFLKAGYDAYVTGSDQIWATVSEWFMLGWTPDHAIRFSIAPSLGHAVYSEEMIAEAKDYLSRYNFITVREENGIALCKSCGLKQPISRLLDPAFLLTFHDYLSLVPRNVAFQHKSVFIYILGAEIETRITQILQFCNDRNLSYRYVESQGRCEDVDEKEYPTLQSWISAINDADYIITNSFHGMAMSIIFHKRFIVFPIVGMMKKMNDRIYNVTDDFHLNHRIFSGNMEILFDDIDWSYADSKIVENKKYLTNLVNSL